MAEFCRRQLKERNCFSPKVTALYYFFAVNFSSTSGFKLIWTYTEPQKSHIASTKFWSDPVKRVPPVAILDEADIIYDCQN